MTRTAPPMTVARLLERAAIAAHEAEIWAATNPGLAALRRRDARVLVEMARRAKA